MKNSRKKLIIIMRLVCIVLFITASIFMLTHPFDNQNVTIYIDTLGKVYERTFAPDEIKSMTNFTIYMDPEDVESLKEIRFTRCFNTITIGKISKSELDSYAEYYVKINEMHFYENMCERIAGYSKSFFLERLLGIEIITCIILLILIAINALSEKLDLNNCNNHGPMHDIRRFFTDVKKYGPYMVYAAKSDLRAEVANSYLNRLWWLLEPMFNMLVYVIVFGGLMGRSVENYATFVFSALLMWNYFNRTINYSVKCVRSNRDIVTKVYVPKHVLLISNMILNFYKLVFSLIVLVPMLFIFRVHIGINVLWVLPSLIVMIILSFGVGMIFLHYGVFIDDLSYAITIVLQMTMFLSGIFYEVITTLAVPLNFIMLALNPVAMFIDTMRNALIYNRVTNVPFIFVWAIISILISYVGIHTVYKNENGYVKVV